MIYETWKMIRLFFNLWGADWWYGHKITAWEAYQVAKLVWLS